MEKALNDAQRELADIRMDRDIKAREAAAMESRFADLLVSYTESSIALNCGFRL